ncbi:hypothetical protein PVK06_012117 [Gossypium arboreum]|uniref:40S ribosomal protein S25 n=1 Tax=Gossypium arboreum TaxID=29729 RepID=A0ABR0QBS2_GOSAR|nr:hypothetical protein PVK06_012117 [Gossypium arboreum]
MVRKDKGKGKAKAKAKPKDNGKAKPNKGKVALKPKGGIAKEEKCFHCEWSKSCCIRTTRVHPSNHTNIWRYPIHKYVAELQDRNLVV